jgi:hypothetical protein
MAEHDAESDWVKDFIDCIKRSRRANRAIGDALSLKQSYLPNRIYKYRGINEHSLKALQTNQIWMASPDTLNDPYDCSFKIVEEQAAAGFARSAFPSHTRAQKAAELRKISIPDYIFSAVESLRLMRHTTKICSFSAVHDSLLMWSHYAEDHAGLCIEYDIEPIDPQHHLRRHLFPVIYSKELHDLTEHLVAFAANSPDGTHEFDPLLAVLQKFDGWQYEREWRLVKFEHMLRPDHTEEVPRPSRVLLGSKTSQENAAVVAEICVQQGIEIWKMKLVPDRFELLAQPYLVPGSER